MTSQSKSSQHIRIKRAIFVSLPSLLFLIFLLGKDFLSDRCSIINCEPAKWSKVQEIIIKNTNSWGVEYRLKEVEAHSKIDTSGKIYEINYVVYYVSTKPESTSRKTIYKIRQIRFDNLNLWIDRADIGLPATSLPAGENILRLKQTIQPEEVIKSTYDLATEALGQSTSQVMLELKFTDEKHDTKAMWEITYFGDNKKQVHFVLDAQSGKIIDNK